MGKAVIQLVFVPVFISGKDSFGLVGDTDDADATLLFVGLRVRLLFVGDRVSAAVGTASAVLAFR